MKDTFDSFTKSAKDFSKNPLGIIALFIVLVYGFACLLFTVSSSSLSMGERSILIWFVVLFPVLIVVLFSWLVTQHHNKLYAPSDFREDRAFLEAAGQYTDHTEKYFNPSSSKIEDLAKYGEGFEIVDARIREIEKDLSERNIDYTSKTSEMFVRQIAGLQVLLWFERVMKVIYDSQIKLLKTLSNSPEGLDDTALHSHYTEVKNKHPDFYRNWELNDYLKYLFESNLIENKSAKLILTVSGSEFLRILDTTNHTVNEYNV